MYDVKTSPLIDFNKEKEGSEEILKTTIGDFSWDTVKGHLELESSHIEAENFEHKLKASFYDSFDIDEGVFRLSYNGVDTMMKISKMDLINYLDDNGISFMRVLNKLVIEHFESEIDE